MEPNLDLPWWLPIAPIDMIEICWLPLLMIALMTGFAAALSGGRWLLFMIGSSVCTFVGLCSGFAISLPTDPIAASFVPYIVAVETMVAIPVSLIAALAGRKLPVSNERGRRAIWIAFACCAGLGPLALALTPPLVAHRVARNDRLATERFKSLKIAVEKMRAESADPGHICDGQALKRNYSGPPFSDQDWSFIAGNYVQEDGYAYGIWV